MDYHNHGTCCMNIKCTWCFTGSAKPFEDIC